MKRIGIIFIFILLSSHPVYSQSWTVYESENYTFYYTESTITKPELERIAEIQEDIFDFVSGFLGVEYTKKIGYYLHPSREEFKSFAGGYVGESGKVHWLCEMCGTHYCTNWKGDPHEITHILSFEIGLPSTLFMEGLAIYVSDVYFGEESYSRSKILLENDAVVPPSDLVRSLDFREHDPVVSYNVAGSFVAFMIETYGIERFLRLYSESPTTYASIDMNTERIYGKSFEDLENEWISFLQAYEYEVLEIKDCKEMIEKSGKIYFYYFYLTLRLEDSYSEYIECDFRIFWWNLFKDPQKAKEILEKIEEKVEILDQATLKLKKDRALFIEGTYDEIAAELEVTKEMFREVGAWKMVEKMEMYGTAFEHMQEGERNLEARNYSEARMNFVEAKTLFEGIEELQAKAENLIQVCDENLKEERARTGLILIVVVLTLGFIILKKRKERT